MIIQLEINSRAPLAVIMRRVLEELGAADRRGADDAVRVVGRKPTSRRQVPKMDLATALEHISRDSSISPEDAFAIIERARAGHEESLVRSIRAKEAWKARKARASQPPQASAP